MKRSEINTILLDADAFIKSNHFHLPPFAWWSPESWKTKGEEARGIVENGLGWDITDFAEGNFEKTGLVLFTIRNGSPENLETMHGKVYAEKLLLVNVDQVTPFHFHWNKMEDIINRGGGKLLIQLYNSTPGEKLDMLGEVRVSVDSVWRTVEAGGLVALEPGESITLPQGLYHKFWAAGERVMAGEVSMVNDDHLDNRFLQPLSRFPQIEEDEPPVYLLVTDYERYYSPSA